ncbi:hypothetical protein [Methanobacterium formicicum]|uniref:hypothetical protein n=1 Tax=Methanobacterium formicicum TaxID=2162 RepID=UPI00248F47B5|nr:hypothetical protein [Methanobacterium formicicum]
MEIRKNFGRYWIAGFILNLILFAIQLLGGISINNILLNQKIILNNSISLSILVIVVILIFIFGFWFYGRIIELLYKKIIRKT